MFKNRKRRFFDERTLLILLLTASLGINLLLAYQLQENRAFIGQLLHNRQLTIGELAPLLKVHDQESNEVAVDLATHEFPTLLYLQSRVCHWCRQNAASLLELVRQAPGKYRIVILHFEEPGDVEGATTLGPAVETFFEPTIEARLSFDLTSTPTTMLFSSDGRLQKVWKGAYSHERKVDIEVVLGVQLPDFEGGGF